MLMYLVSLKSDYIRREKIAINFPSNFKKIIHFEAINGKMLTVSSFFSYSSIAYQSHNKFLTPGEVGCTLSHLGVLNKFLETNEEYCLVLEDDIIGNDNHLFQIEKIIDNIDLNGVINFRNQNGFGFEKFILGKEMSIKGLYQIPRFSAKFILGTCAYCIDRNSAKKIIDFHEKYFNVADCWGDILRLSDINLYYFPLINHPEDDFSSNIEQERSLFYKKKGFFSRNVNRFIFMYFIKIYFFIFGYNKIH